MSRPNKQFLNPTLTPKIAHHGPKKSEMNLKLSQNRKSELKDWSKIKVVQLYEYTPKQFLSATKTPKDSPLGPQKDKNDPKI